eukprot:m.295885 g.295885  ORF g.295885 m.295885 type:complete len:61 (-) comp27186_c0_seq1:83-265(-)
MSNGLCPTPALSPPSPTPRSLVAHSLPAQLADLLAALADSRCAADVRAGVSGSGVPRQFG